MINCFVSKKMEIGDIMIYFYALVVAFLIAFTIMPRLIRIAKKIDFVDKPIGRKKQKKPMPLVGGLGVFISFFLSYIIFMRPLRKEFLSIFVASLLVFAIGIVDDWYKSKRKEFPAMPRLIIQILSAVLIYNSGIVFNGFNNPFTHNYMMLPKIVSLVFTIIWIVGVTTVINWTDGVDGLAGTLSSIAASTLFIVALAKNQDNSAIMSVLLLGALLAFLLYNKYPAKTYFGDSGANFAGFILSIIALDGAFKQATIISVAIPILALGVPIIDNLYVVLNRIIQRRPIHKADASQIHHRLLSRGLHPKQVVMFISLMSICLSLCAIIILLLKV
jgi:UDP-N-acetylmuramyl pentapeptide phosphotransferase/UDP-N-acetylglucosamine-1-phosphate transferase